MKKKRPHYVYIMLGLVPVLVLIGAAAILSMTGRILANEWLENINVVTELHPDRSQGSEKAIIDQIKSLPFVLQEKVKFIPGKEGIAFLNKELGQDLVSVTDSILLPDMIVFNVRSTSMQEDTLRACATILEAVDGVHQVTYESVYVQRIRSLVVNTALALLVAGLIFLLLAVLIIYNTVKIAMYMDRIAVKTQQLIGASESFIRKPFLRQSLWSGFRSALLSIVLLGVMCLVLARTMEFIPKSTDYLTFALICLGLILIGVIIPVVTSYFVVKRISRKPIDQLY